MAYILLSNLVDSFTLRNLIWKIVRVFYDCPPWSMISSSFHTLALHDCSLPRLVKKQV